MKKFVYQALFLFCGFLPAHAVQFSTQEAGTITAFTGHLLQQMHFRQVRLNEDISATFLQNYLDAMDASHMIFTYADVEEFQKNYESQLHAFVKEADAGPAFEIFKRYTRRLNERYTTVTNLLEREFDFTINEEFPTDRSEADWPRTQEEADNLWRLRLKYEMLLGLIAEEDEAKIRERLEKRYRQLAHRMEKFETEDILQIYLTALANAFDPHSSYLSPSEAENFTINQINLALTGIGALLQSEDGYTKIVSLIPGGPAEKSGELKPGDRIVQVAQGDEEPVDVVEELLKNVVNLIRGTIKTEVRLTILPADGSVKKVISLIRDRIELKSQHASARIVDYVDAEQNHRLFGLVELPQFYHECASHVATLIEALQKENIDGLILDLRRNSGGILDEAIALAGLFIDRGPIVQVKDSFNQQRPLRDTFPKTAYDGPLLVAVSRLSASASEIVAAALQDYERALIVGDETTHGKGTVQTIANLTNYIPARIVANPGEVKFTISKFYRVEGNTTQRHGVTPDIILPSIYDHLDLGEAKLKNSLEPDKIAAADYEPVNQVNPFVGSLRPRSQTRVQQDKDFSYIREDIEELEERRAKKSVSLNMETRLKEKEDKEKIMEQRKEERKNRPESGYKVYELTLEMIEKGEPKKLMTTTAPKTADGIIELPPEKEADTPAEEAAGEDDPEEEKEEEPLLDPYMIEYLHIMNDYAGLLPRRGGRLLAGPWPSKN